MIDPPILGESFCLHTFILKKRRFFVFHTPTDTKFLLDTPQKTVHGKSKNSPPQQEQEEQRFSLPDLSAAPQIKRVGGGV